MKDEERMAFESKMALEYPDAPKSTIDFGFWCYQLGRAASKRYDEDGEERKFTQADMERYGKCYADARDARRSVAPQAALEAEINRLRNDLAAAKQEAATAWARHAMANRISSSLQDARAAFSNSADKPYSAHILELAHQAIQTRDNDTRTEAEKIEDAVDFICDTRTDLPLSVVQPSEPAASPQSGEKEGEPVAWMTLDCVHLKPASVYLDRTEVECMRPEHVVPLYARAAAPQAALTDEQTKAIAYAVFTLDMVVHKGGDRMRHIAALKSLLTQAPTERMSDDSRRHDRQAVRLFPS